MNNLSEILVDLSPGASIGLKITLVLAIGWILHFLLFRCNPRWRVLLWRTVMAGVVSVPILALGGFWQVSIEPPLELNPPDTMPLAFSSDLSNNYPLALPRGGTESYRSASYPQTSEPPIIEQEAAAPTFSLWDWTGKYLGAIAAIIWGGGVVILAGRFIILLINLRRKITAAAPAPQRLQDWLDREAHELGYRKKIALRCSDQLSAPFLYGLRRPIIVIAPHLAEPQRVHELPAILAHEVAHLLSHDLYWMLLGRWLSTLLWFHPLIWRLPAAHQKTCEEVCDAVAADYIGNVDLYSGTLARVALKMAGPTPAAGGVAMLRSANIVHRLKKLKSHITFTPLARHWVALSLTIGLIALAGIGGVKLVYAQDAAADEQANRVLHFPKDRSLGRLSKLIHLEPWVLDNTNPPDVWEDIGQAQGEVTVPRDARVKLAVNKTALRDLSPLARLRPDDLYHLRIDGTNYPVNNPDQTIMPYLRNLTGLEVLVIEDVSISYQGLRYIGNFKSLKQLVLNLDSKIDDASLELLGNIKSLEALALFDSAYTDQGLQHLTRLPRLRELGICVDHIRGPGLMYLEKIPSLRFLMLTSMSEGGSFSNSGMQYIKNLTFLKKITLWANLGITDAGLAPLANLAGLEELRIGQMESITDRGMVHLKSLPSLKKLNLNMAKVGDRGLAQLKTIKSLEYLKIAPGETVTDKGLAEVSELTNLKFLQHGGSVSDVGLEHLTKLHSLEVLRTGGEDITDAGMAHIAQMTNLKTLSVFRSPITDRGLAHLTALKSLEELRLNYSKITFSGLTQLNTLPNLRHLYVDNVSRGDSPLNISQLTQLESFNLTQTRVRDEDIACLAKLTNLKKLQLSGSITDKGMADLAGLTALTWLDINGGAGLTDAGLVHLTNMNQLKNLMIKGNYTDKGLQHLEELKALWILHLTPQKPLSSAALQRLRQKRPSLTIYLQGKPMGIAAFQQPDSPSDQSTNDVKEGDLFVGEYPLKDLDMSKYSGSFIADSLDNPGYPGSKWLAAKNAIPAPPAGRVLRFHPDRSLGEIHIRDAKVNSDITDFLYWVRNDNKAWKYLGPARGEVVVPAGKIVKLEIAHFRMNDLSILKNFAPDDFYAILFQYGVDQSTFASLPTATDKNLQDIQHLTGLRELNIKQAKITSAGLQYLQNMKNLEELYLPENITNSGVKYLAQLPSLKRLYLLDCKINNQGLQQITQAVPYLEELALLGEKIGVNSQGLVHLAQLKSLHYLFIEGGKIYDADMVHLQRLRPLKTLTIRRLPLTDNGLRHIGKCQNLQNLCVFNTRVTEKGLAYLTSMPALKKLDLGYISRSDEPLRFTDVAAQHLKQIKSLEYLEIEGDGLSDEALADLAQLPHLKHLNIIAPNYHNAEEDPVHFTDKGLEHLAQAKNLEVLKIVSHAFTDKGMGHLGRLSNLKQLLLAAPNITDRGFAHLNNLKKLQDAFLDTHKITFAGLNMLKDLKELKKLTAHSIRRDNTTLNISGLTNLERFTINQLPRSQSMQDDDLACLASLTQLCSLQIPRGGSDTGMAHLKNLTKLERLVGIGGDKLTDQGLKYLADMKNLHMIAISGSFTDNAFQTLNDLPALTNLHITTTKKFTDDAIRQFQKANPQIYFFYAGKNDALPAGATGMGLMGGYAVLNQNQDQNQQVKELDSFEGIKDVPFNDAEVKETGLDESGNIPKTREDVLKYPKADVVNQDRNQTDQKITAQELLDRYASNQEKQQSFISHNTRTFYADSVIGGQKIFQDYTHKSEIRFDGKRINWRFNQWGRVSPAFSNVPEDDPFYSSRLYDGETYFQYTGTLTIDQTGEFSYPEKGKETLAMGTDIREMMGYFHDGILRIDEVLRRANTISVRPRTEKVAGSDCYIIDADTPRGNYTVWIDPAHGYNIARVEMQKRENDLHVDSAIPKGAEINWSYKIVRFEKIDEVWVPMEAERISERKNYPPADYTGKNRIKRTKVILNPDHEALHSFVPDDIKNGVSVHLYGSSTNFAYTWQDGKAVDKQGKVMWEYKHKILPKAQQDLQPEKITVKELLDRYGANQDKLQSFISHDTWTRYAEVYGDDFVWDYTENIEVCFDGSRCSHNVYSWGRVNRAYPNVPENDPFYVSFLYDGETFFGYGSGGIDKNGILTINDTGEYSYSGQGLPTFAERGRISNLMGYFYGDYQRIDAVFRQARTISVRPRTEKVAGADCYVIDADTPRGDYTVWIDPAHGYNIARVDKQIAENDLFGADNRAFSKGDKETASYKILRFEKIDGAWIPMETDSVVEQGWGMYNNHIKRTKVILDPNHEALHSFVPDDIQNGAQVYLYPSTDSYQWQDGKAVDKQGKVMWEYKYKVPQKAEPKVTPRQTIVDPDKPPLSVQAGKPLPSLAEFNIKLDADKTKDKRILVLFWDMNQRPSRDCINELAKKAPELTKKDVTIAAVQIPKVYAESLKIWLEYNKTPFPVGMIEGDQEKIKADWGIQTLPMLLVTDKQHKVMATGLGLDQIDTFIK